MSTVEKKNLKFFWIQSGILNAYGSFMVPEKNLRFNRLRSAFNSFIFPPVMIPLGYTILMSYPDITIMVSLMGLFIGFLSSSFKLPTLHFRIRHFIGVRQRVRELYERVQPGEEEYMERIVKFVQKLALANGIALVFGSALLILTPPTFAFVQTIKGVENVTWPTPFDADYFVDMESRFNYAVVNLWCLYTLMLCVIMNNCIDCIFFESCLVAAAHFRILQNRIRQLPFWREDFSERLLDVVRYQKEIYGLAREIQLAYCTILCPFFIIASIMSCAEFYTATVVESTSMRAVYIGYSFSCLFQIFFYTYGGHEMILESGRINDAIFNSDWHAAAPEKRKSLIMIMMRCQHECRITAGFFDVSMVTFSKVGGDGEELFKLQ